MRTPREYGIIRGMGRLATRQKNDREHGVVLLFAKPVYASNHERINGVYAAAIERGWQIQQVSEVPTRKSVETFVRIWHPIGCIVEQSAMPKSINRSMFGDTPVVMTGRGNIKSAKWFEGRFDCSFQNVRGPVEHAARELVSLNPASFAYIDDPAHPLWGVERGRLFADTIPPGSTFATYNGPSPMSTNGHRALAKWLKGRPLPCACLLATDHIAPTFYIAARSAGLRVGVDLPTLGFDNVEHICLSLSPRLSSVKIDFFRSGVDAVRLLERRLANPETEPKTLTYEAIGVERRASTMRNFADSRVLKGMSAVEERACGRLTTGDVAAEMGCCVRLAEKLFRRDAGVSILEAIRRVRIERAMSLLRNRYIAIDAIPFRCGYGRSPACLKTHFKKATGLTMREWRKRHVS